jgi:hypothetical protein
MLHINGREKLRVQTRAALFNENFQHGFRTHAKIAERLPVQREPPLHVHLILDKLAQGMNDFWREGGLRIVAGKSRNHCDRLFLQPRVAF